MSGDKLPNQHSQSLSVDPRIAQIFQNAAKGMARVEARIVSNLEYMQYLEFGTRHMPARPVLEPYLALYKEMIEDELRHAVLTYPGQWELAAQAGIAMAAQRIMAYMADHTAMPEGPYFTGRAKGSWTAFLPGGRTVQSGNVITAEQQRAILKNRRAALRKKAKP